MWRLVCFQWHKSSLFTSDVAGHRLTVGNAGETQPFLFLIFFPITETFLIAEKK